MPSEDSVVTRFRDNIINRLRYTSIKIREEDRDFQFNLLSLEGLLMSATTPLSRILLLHRAHEITTLPRLRRENPARLLIAS